MNNLEKEYNKVTAQRTAIIEELNQLKCNEAVKRYLELNNENSRLYVKQCSLYSSINSQKYAECKHILVFSKIEYDRFEGRTHKRCGCIKCGLDTSVLDENRDWLPLDQKTMYDYLRKNHFSGTMTNILCDINLATSIYSKIKETHPDIDDETALKYFEIALRNIRNIPVSDERKLNRAKRLSLNSNFRRWDSKDIFD